MMQKRWQQQRFIPQPCPIFRAPTPLPLLLVLLKPFPKALWYVFGGRTALLLPRPKDVACDLVPTAAVATSIPVVFIPIVPAGKGQFLHPRESTAALAQLSGKGRSFPPRYGGRDTYVEVLDKKGSRSNRGDAVPDPPSSTTASSSTSVLVGMTIPLLNFTRTSLDICTQGKIEGKTDAKIFVYDLNITL